MSEPQADVIYTTPSLEVPPTFWVLVTCHVVDCPNAEHTFAVEVPETVTGYVCGGCSTPITDVVEQPTRRKS